MAIDTVRRLLGLHIGGVLVIHLLLILVQLDERRGIRLVVLRIRLIVGAVLLLRLLVSPLSLRTLAPDSSASAAALLVEVSDPGSLPSSCMFQLKPYG